LCDLKGAYCSSWMLVSSAFLMPCTIKTARVFVQTIV
jgi:hypothetical protein